MTPVATFVSFRLGGTDGVAVETRKWEWALGELGFATRRVAGNLTDPTPDDVEIPALGHTSTVTVPDPYLLRAALNSDLVIVENLCSLPLNLSAARLVARVLGEPTGRVLFHHHDLPWQRREFAAVETEFPPHIPGSLHVTINTRSRRDLNARGYNDVITLPNHFDLDPLPGNRTQARDRLGFRPEELVVFQPGRAIYRKNVPGGLRLAHHLDGHVEGRPVRYWLSGPAEDGYDTTLDRVLERSPVPTTLGNPLDIADAYAASDIVVLPSTWEGFGNTTIESIATRRPLSVFRYPVLSEIVATGVRFFDIDDPGSLIAFLQQSPDQQVHFHEVNRRRAQLSFSLENLPAALDRMFTAHGWDTW